MTRDSYENLKNYGFEYQVDGKDFTFVVAAESQADAERHSRAMVESVCVGELHEAIAA